MELTNQQIKMLKKELGNSKFNEIVNQDFTEKSIFMVTETDIYKLHRVGSVQYAFVDMDTSECYATGTFDATQAKKYIKGHSNVKVFNNFQEALKSGFLNRV